MLLLNPAARGLADEAVEISVVSTDPHSRHLRASPSRFLPVHWTYLVYPAGAYLYHSLFVHQLRHDCSLLTTRNQATGSMAAGRHFFSRNDTFDIRKAGEATTQVTKGLSQLNSWRIMPRQLDDCQWVAGPLTSQSSNGDPYFWSCDTLAQRRSITPIVALMDSENERLWI
jgi:hypothetical protein